MHRVGVVIMCLAVGVAAASARPERGNDPKVPGATAELKDSRGQEVGRVMLRETPEGVLLYLELESLEPGVKAFHIHETGRCDGPTFESAGGHFNPAKLPHGLLSPSGAHAGDLPNIHVPETGMLSVEVLAPGVTLSTGERSLLDADGSAVVVHAKADDYASDPAGNAGDRIACGMVKK